MMMRNTLAMVTVGLGLFVTGAMAQHDHHNDDATPPAATAKMGAMMMSCKDEAAETSKLAGQLQKSFEAIEAEKDPAALKTKLAEHGDLLKEMQAKIDAHTHRMEMMHNMMGGEHKN